MQISYVMGGVNNVNKHYYSYKWASRDSPKGA
jgi:hypothetical protein